MMSTPRRLASLVFAVVCVGTTLCVASVASAVTVTELRAGFEDGIVPPGWQTLSRGTATASVVATRAHTGTYSLRQQVPPDNDFGTETILRSALPSDGERYELDLWYFVNEAHGWGMTASAFTFRLTDGSNLGPQFSSNSGGSLGYLTLDRGTVGPLTIWGQNVPTGTWRHLVITYDVVTQTEDVQLDGVYLQHDLPVSGTAPNSVMVWAYGGWSRGNTILQHVDDIVVRVWSAETETQTIRIDVRPGQGGRAIINPREHGRVPVAILSDTAFRPTDVDVGSIVFAGAHPVPRTVQFRDLNHDGRKDLVVWFRVEDMSLTAGPSVSLELTGSTRQGIAFSGTDKVRVLGPPRRPGRL
jgi:hypothetical protein